MSLAKPFGADTVGLREPPYRYHFDPALKLIHLFRDCGGLKVAQKYSEVETITVNDAYEAAALDEMGRPCHTCWKREAYWAEKDGRPRRPGFKREPRR